MSGRWPANVILTPAMAEVLDGQSGAVGANGDNGHKPESKFPGTYSGTFESHARPDPTARDKGGASRFFLQAGYEPWELEWILANGLRPAA